MVEKQETGHYRERLGLAHSQCDIDGIKRIITELNQSDDSETETGFWKKYYLARAHSLMSDCFFKGKTKEIAYNHARGAADTLSSLAKQGDPAVDAEVYALLGGVLGHVSAGASDPVSKASLGMRADRALAQALELGPDNPRALLMHGRSLLLKPRLFGGNKKKAIRILAQAHDSLPENEPPAPWPDWGREEACFWLAYGLLHFNRFAEARDAIAPLTKCNQSYYLTEPMLGRIAEKEASIRREA